jgi:nitrogen-specific signal transduction histidine kinase
MEELKLIDVNESIRRTAELARKQVRRYPIEVEFRLSPSSPRVLAPPTELTQAMFGLLMNSAQMVSSARSSGRIQITTAVIRDRVLVSVTDDVTAKETDTRFRLSRNKIREIGGDLWISRQESFGTTCTMDLPLASMN